MKKSIIKYIREEAAKLPQKLVPRKQKVIFTAEEIREFEETNYLPITGKKTSTSKTVRMAYVNHENIMKQLFNTGGMAAVKEYIAKNATPVLDGASGDASVSTPEGE